MKTFKEITETQNTLMIVDGLNLAFRYKHGKVRDFATDYIRTVQSLQKSYKAAKVIITCDKGSSSFRKAIYPEYKQNRKDKFDNQTEQEKQEFEEFFTDFEETMSQCAEHFEVLRYQGVEADDLAAYLVSKRRALGFDNIWLISSDRDWDLLLKPNVHRFSYVTRKEYTLLNWHEHYEFDHDDYMSIKCLMGDAGDNIIGIPGVGPKRAQGLVEDYGSVFDIIQAYPLQGKYKYIVAINDNIDRLELNHKLVDIETFCDEAIGEENIININERLGI